MKWPFSLFICMVFFFQFCPLLDNMLVIFQVLLWKCWPSFLMQLFHFDFFMSLFIILTHFHGLLFKISPLLLKVLNLRSEMKIYCFEFKVGGQNCTWFLMVELPIDDYKLIICWLLMSINLWFLKLKHNN